jgi:hypothetical protein
MIFLVSLLPSSDIQSADISCIASFRSQTVSFVGLCFKLIISALLLMKTWYTPQQPILPSFNRSADFVLVEACPVNAVCVQALLMSFAVSWLQDD